MTDQPADVAIQDIAKLIVRQMQAGERLDLTAHSSAKWGDAVDLLLDFGQFRAGVFAMRQMRPAFPKVEFVQTMLDVVARMPPEGPQAPIEGRFRDGVRVSRREGCDRTILSFAGGAGDRGTGVHLPILHRYLGLLDANIIYLSNVEPDAYVNGVNALGDTAEATSKALRQLLQSLGTRQLFCYGNSTGGYGAIRYGLKLGAEAVLAMAPPTNLEPKFNAHLRLAKRTHEGRLQAPDAQLDLRPLWEGAERPPRLVLVHGEANWDDRIHADHLRGLPGVEIRTVADLGAHHVITELIRREAFMPLLQDVFGTAEGQIA